MEKYVTQEECEQRRNELENKIDNTNNDMLKMFGIVTANTVEIKNLTKTISLGLSFSITVLGGLVLWALTI